MSFVRVFWGRFITLFTAEGILNIKELSFEKVFTCIILGGWGVSSTYST